MSTNKKRVLIVSALFLITLIIVPVIIKRGHLYDIELFKSDGGWGYDILKNNRTYIHQPFIPAIEGETPFSDKKSARNTAKLVVKKLRNHQIPAVSKEEMESIVGK